MEPEGGRRSSVELITNKPMTEKFYPDTKCEAAGSVPLFLYILDIVPTY
jgi:hypothetical protein